jgi:hypothetical protein
MGSMALHSEIKRPKYGSCLLLPSRFELRTVFAFTPTVLYVLKKKRLLKGHCTFGATHAYKLSASCLPGIKGTYIEPNYSLVISHSVTLLTGAMLTVKSTRRCKFSRLPTFFSLEGLAYVSLYFRPPFMHSWHCVRHRRYWYFLNVMWKQQ